VFRNQNFIFGNISPPLDRNERSITGISPLGETTSNAWEQVSLKEGKYSTTLTSEIRKLGLVDGASLKGREIQIWHGLVAYTHVYSLTLRRSILF
jgi:hypothetical protein